MEINPPYFSVIIPSYNRADFLKKTILSVQNQQFRGWECIIIDDGSTDHTEALLKELIAHDHRLYYVYQENSERSVARNNGIDQAKGKYICFLDSDDFYLPEHLQVMKDEIERKKEPKALFFTNAFDQNEQQVISNRNRPDIEVCSSVQDYILQYTFNPARVAVHSSIVNEIQFDSRIPGLEDLEVWLRISINYPVYQIKKRTIIYNLHATSYTIGDLKRYQKELNFFRYIFQKPELKGKLSKNSTNRLISMCHYHLALKANLENNKGAFYLHALQSIVLCPSGYNGKTTKPLFVLMVYSIPLIGRMINTFVRFVK